MTRSVHQSTQRHLAQRWRRRNAAARAACFGGIIAALSDTAPIRRLCIAPLCIMYRVSESADLLLLWLESEGQAFGPFLPPPTAGFRGGRGSRNGGFVTALKGRRCLIRDPTRRLRCARRAQGARLQSLAMRSKTRRKFRGVDPVRPRLLWRGYERLAGRLMIFGTFRNRCVTFDVWRGQLYKPPFCQTNTPRAASSGQTWEQRAFAASSIGLLWFSTMLLTYHSWLLCAGQISVCSPRKGRPVLLPAGTAARTACTLAGWSPRQPMAEAGAPPLASHPATCAAGHPRSSCSDPSLQIFRAQPPA
jgi:hypothetical protein